MNVEQYLDRPEIHEYRVFSTGQIPFSPAVVEACERNACGKYGTSWTCPPGVGTLEELEKKIRAYPNAAVLTCRYDIEDSFDFEGMMDAQKKAKKVFAAVADEMRAVGETFYMLGNEGCDLCAKCTYPDAPCRFPERAAPSVEACGINVMLLAKTVGVRYNNGPNTVTYFSLILFGKDG